MISTLLVWIYIFLLTTLAGHFVFRTLGKLQRKETSAEPSTTELSITGLTFLGIFLSIFSLFLKIGLAANLSLFTLCFIYFLIARDSIFKDFKNIVNGFKQLPSIVKVLISVYLVLILIAAQSVPAVSDTGLYHIQNIKWINSFKIVPGLGNLHGRFAFNNQSFLAEALFSFSFLKPDFFHLLNSYLMLILSVTLIIQVNKKLTHDILRAFMYAGLFILLQVFYLKSASSPTPDIFSLAGIWFIFIIYLEKITGENGNKLYWIPLLAMAFFMITVKLSAFPVALVAVLFMVESSHSLLKNILLISFIAVLVFVPYFIRNYIISGYLVYPYASIDIFNPDWKIPVQYVSEMRSVISSHAQTGDWLTRTFSEWFPIWFGHLSTGFKILSGYILISPALILGLYFHSDNLRKRFGKELKIVAICFLAILFWFVSAPNFRFVYAFLLFYVLITCSIIINSVSGKLSASGFTGRLKEKIYKVLPVTAPILLVLISILFLFTLNLGGLRQSVFFPARFREVPCNKIKANNFIVNIPADGTYCWNSPLPCSIVQKDIGITDIELRGAQLKEGFRTILKKQ
jgi:hypothetical protein